MPAVENHTDNGITGHIIRIDSRKMEEIFPKYFERLVYFANKYLNDEEKARDAVHEMFLDIWEKREVIIFNDERQLKMYLYLGTKSKAVNIQRRSEKEEKELRGLTIYSEKDNHHPEEMDKALYQAEAIAAMRQVIDNMPPQCRTVMDLLLKGRTLEEISQLLNMTPVAVRQNKFQGISVLKKKLKSHALLPIALLLLGLSHPTPH